MGYDDYDAREKAQKHALKKLHEAERSGAPGERAFMRYLARLDKAGCGLTLPLGYYVDNPPPGFTPAPSPWHNVIQTFRDRKQNDPSWFVELQQEVACEERGDRISGILGCGGFLLVTAFVVWLIMTHW